MEPTAEFRIYIVRRADQPKWFTKARGGDEVAKTCIWAGSKYMKVVRKGGQSQCSICSKAFSRKDGPSAFLVLIPVEWDPETVRAKAAGLCADCSIRDDRSLSDEIARREGWLSTGPPRPGDQVH